MSLLDQRLKEARRLGMTVAVIPSAGKLPESVGNMRIVRVSGLGEAVAWLMDQK